MKSYRQFILSVLLAGVFAITATAQVDKNVQKAFEEKEQNPSIFLDAKNVAVNLNLPLKIVLEDNSFLEVMRFFHGDIQYCLIKNFAHPLEGAELLTYSEVATRFDLSKAYLFYENDFKVKEPSNNYPNGRTPSKLFLVPDWTADRVMAFDIQTGNVVNENFIPTNNPNLQSPKEARYNPGGFISVSDQISDLVQKYDTSGNYVAVLAPVGGVNPTLLDNMRGHNYRPGNGNLVVAVGSGGNQNAIAEFDLSGNYIGNFISVGAGGLNSPFCITFRQNDVLVSGSTSDAVHRYDLNGNYLSDFAVSIQFPQQVVVLPNGNIGVAVFSVPSGLAIYSPSGTQLSFWTQVTGNRGVARLGNGNYLTTNGAGIHELDTLGNLVRTISTGTNMQYINYVDFGEIIPVELSSFTANFMNEFVRLNWNTSSEKNNSGFEIERASASGTYEKIGFVAGRGTTTEPTNYSFDDFTINNSFNGAVKYHLKQIDLDGKYSYSREIEIDINSFPKEFSLRQNYPNPFNPTTNIGFELPQTENVTLKIFDVLGNEVAILINNELLGAGTHNYQLSTINYQLISGVYFYQLNAGSFSSTKKLILTK